MKLEITKDDIIYASAQLEPSHIVSDSELEVIEQRCEEYFERSNIWSPKIFDKIVKAVIDRKKQGYSYLVLKKPIPGKPDLKHQIYNEMSVSAREVLDMSIPTYDPESILSLPLGASKIVEEDVRIHILTRLT